MYQQLLIPGARQRCVGRVTSGVVRKSSVETPIRGWSLRGLHTAQASRRLAPACHRRPAVSRLLTPVPAPDYTSRSHTTSYHSPQREGRQHREKARPLRIAARCRCGWHGCARAPEASRPSRPCTIHTCKHRRHTRTHAQRPWPPALGPDVNRAALPGGAPVLIREVPDRG